MIDLAAERTVTENALRAARARGDTVMARVLRTRSLALDLIEKYRRSDAEEDGEEGRLPLPH